MSGPTKYTLKIFIDPQLLNPTRLANLTLARIVNTTANVIFQSKVPELFSEGNNLEWSEAYEIGATQSTPGDGAQISCDTGLQPIGPDEVCIWKAGWTNMPAATPAPSTWPEGQFGTINLTSPWLNVIYGQTGTSTFSAMYVDVDPVPGLNRSYLPTNNFQVSWETSNDAAGQGIYFTQFSSPWSFDYKVGETTHFISWGCPAGHTPNNSSPQWYDYGTNNPGKHNPPTSLTADSPFDDGYQGILDIIFRIFWKLQPPLTKMAIAAAAKYIGNLILAKLQGKHPKVTVTLTGTQSGQTVDYKFNIGNVNQESHADIIKVVNGILRLEQARRDALPPPNQSVPTPDPMQASDPPELAYKNKDGLLITVPYDASFSVV